MEAVLSNMTLRRFSGWSTAGFDADGSWARFHRQPGRISLSKTGELHSIRSVAEDGESGSRKRSVADVSRRQALQTAFTLCSSTTFVGSILGDNRAWAEECGNGGCDLPITKKVFFDVSIDGQPVGRIVVGLFGTDVPIGSQRFAELAIGQRGISYRRKEFQKITPTFIQNVGVRTFSLSGGTADAANFTGGETSESLMTEMVELDKKGSRPKNLKGTVSLVVVDPTKPPPKPRLVAQNGKFVMVEEESRSDPNGTEFMIVTADAPQLDASNLVVGRVVEGMDVVQQISQVKVVQENSGSPYFQAAKLIGDSRAVVAERGFYRPYSKILITKSGEIE